MSGWTSFTALPLQHEKFQSEPGSRVGTPAYLAPEVILTTRGKTYDGKVPPPPLLTNNPNDHAQRRQFHWQHIENSFPPPTHFLQSPLADSHTILVLRPPEGWKSPPDKGQRTARLEEGSSSGEHRHLQPGKCVCGGIVLLVAALLLCLEGDQRSTRCDMEVNCTYCHCLKWKG